MGMAIIKLIPTISPIRMIFSCCKRSKQLTAAIIIKGKAIPTVRNMIKAKWGSIKIDVITWERTSPVERIHPNHLLICLNRFKITTFFIELKVERVPNIPLLCRRTGLHKQNIQNLTNLRNF